MGKECIHLVVCKFINEKCIDGICNCWPTQYKANGVNAVLYAMPITAGDSYGVQFLCSACDFPKNDMLAMDMKYCWNCGIKLDWSEWEK